MRVFGFRCFIPASRLPWRCAVFPECASTRPWALEYNPFGVKTAVRRAFPGCARCQGGALEIQHLYPEGVVFQSPGSRTRAPWELPRVCKMPTRDIRNPASLPRRGCIPKPRVAHSRTLRTQPTPQLTSQGQSGDLAISSLEERAFPSLEPPAYQWWCGTSLRW